MLVAAMVGLDARATMDMDATIKGVDVTLEAVEKIITDIVSVPLILELKKGMGCAGNSLFQSKISAYSSKEENRCALGLIGLCQWKGCAGKCGFFTFHIEKTPFAWWGKTVM